MVCTTGPTCAAQANDLFFSWMLGFELGPHNETTGAAYRNSTFPLGQALASKAVEIDPACSEAAVANSTARVLDWQWKAAVVEANRAVGLNKSSPGAWAWLSKIQTALVDLDGALHSANVAEGLDPTDTGLMIGTGAVLYMKRDWPGNVRLRKNKRVCV
jgi:hypothetical protein